MFGIPALEQVRVLVIGDLMLDRYWHGDTSRISPEAPVPVVRIGDTEERPGGAGNVALNIAALGAQATLVGLLGTDEAANILIRLLEKADINCQCEQLPACNTITKLRVLSRHQQLIRLDFEDNFSGYDGTDLVERCRPLITKTDVVVLSDYAKGALSQSEALIALARAAGKPVVVDPKGGDFRRYRGATLITPNSHEFEEMAGICVDDNTLVARGEALRAELDLDGLLVTRSEKGMLLMEADHPPVHIPTRAREVFDVTGAGDTVVAVLATAIGAGLSLEKATVLANIGASIVVSKLGTATVTVPELRRAMHELGELPCGIVDEDRLVALVQEAKAHGEKVVMTNGCFDILHAGHVAYLEEAARLGDRLVVAVNDDASIKRLKGTERPVNTHLHRMRILAALNCVDWVVGFDEDIPTRLICRVVPDILIKGGDNDPAKIPGGDCVRAAGGEVRVTDYTADLSTTGIIGSIRSAQKISGRE